MTATRNFRIWACLVVMICTVSNLRADFTFGEAVNPGPPLNTSYSDATTCMSADGLSLCFASDRPGGIDGSWDLYVTTRTSADHEWGPEVSLGLAVNSPKDEWAPSLSADGLSLYFTSDRPGSAGGADIWVTTRTSVSDLWGEPVNLGGTVNSDQWDANASILPDGLSLFFGSTRETVGTSHPEYCQIYMTTRPTTSDPWGTPIRLGPTVNRGLEYDTDYPSLSADGRMLLFASNLPGGVGEWDLWVSTRATNDAEWGAPVNLGPRINSAYLDLWPQVSSDGRTLYFCSKRPGGLGGSYGDIWQASITPIVDFNTDGAVDLVDLVMLIDNWGADDALSDIGPMPWGDGKVNVEDLKVFIAEWEKTNPGDSQDTP